MPLCRTKPSPGRRGAATPDSGPEGLSRTQAAPRRPAAQGLGLGARKPPAQAVATPAGRSPGSRRLPGAGQSGRSVGGGRAGTEGHTCGGQHPRGPARPAPAPGARPAGSGNAGPRCLSPAAPAAAASWRLASPLPAGSRPRPRPRGGVCLLRTSSLLGNTIMSASFLSWAHVRQVRVALIWKCHYSTLH